MSVEHVDSHLPLKPVIFQILLSLSNGRHHGYGITRDIVTRESLGLWIESGNLYRALREVCRDGLARESKWRPARADDSRRRYYEITALGRRVVAAEIARLETVIAEAKRRIR
jgi:DNA-binding PadR family transcriptional regulator